MKTALRVLQNFGFIELVMLVLRKYQGRNIMNSRRSLCHSYFPFAVKFSTPSLSFLIKCGCNDANQSDVELYASYMREVESQAKIPRVGFFDQIYDLGPGLGLILFHLLLREKPQKVLETGVAAGTSSNLILSCLAINKQGTLISVDITSKVGELIEDRLKERWDLTVLPNLSKKKAFISHLRKHRDASIFLHDSDHSLKWQIFEISAAIEELQNLDYLLIDDVTKTCHDYIITNFPEWKIIVIDEGQKYSGFMVKNFVLGGI